jgi:hypothetical protein
MQGWAMPTLLNNESHRRVGIAHLQIMLNDERESGGFEF